MSVFNWSFRFNLVHLLVVVIGVTSGCQRPEGQQASSIRIQAPIPQNQILKSGGVGPLSALPSNRKVCYAVMVKGQGLTQAPANTCRPEMGLVSGFVEAGAVLEVSVPKGPVRKFELFAFLQQIGEDLPCPQFQPDFPAMMIQNTYKIAETSIELTEDNVNLVMTPTFPGLSNHFANELALPSSCFADNEPPNSDPNLSGPSNRPGFFVGSVHSRASSGSVILVARVGSPAPVQSASNGQVKLILK